MIVVDASTTISWYLTDEVSTTTEAILDRVVAEGAIVPLIWKLEVANAFRTAIRKKRTTVAQRGRALSALSELDIAIDTSTAERAWTEILALSDKHGLTPYDAAYLDLALRERLPLASLDRDLLAAARAEDLETLP